VAASAQVKLDCCQKLLVRVLAWLVQSMSIPLGEICKSVEFLDVGAYEYEYDQVFFIRQLQHQLDFNLFTHIPDGMVFME
jgi:hypothetical protein